MPKTEAAGNEDSAYLPISERVKIFTKKMESQYISSRVSRRPCSRFKTQPVTAEELEVAKRFTSISSQYISGAIFCFVKFIYLSSFFLVLLNFIYFIFF